MAVPLEILKLLSGLLKFWHQAPEEAVFLVSCSTPCSIKQICPFFKFNDSSLFQQQIFSVVAGQSWQQCHRLSPSGTGVGTCNCVLKKRGKKYLRSSSQHTQLLALEPFWQRLQESALYIRPFDQHHLVHRTAAGFVKMESPAP